VYLIHLDTCLITLFSQGSAEKYRDAAGHLARETGGVCLSVNYRLSPQHVFPAALLDLVLVYMSLQFPSADAPHSPISASRIVLAGDSAGANLMFVLLKVLLCIQSAERPIMFHGNTVAVNCPAAIGCLSLVADQSFSLPSHNTNAKYDVLGHRTPWSNPNYPACEIWPSSPPRSNIYCHGLSNSHPLVSPAMSRSWKGSPPMWLAYGEEKMIDGGKMIAQQAMDDGVVVSWNFFEAMPHCFPLIMGLGGVKHMREFWNEWGTFFRSAVTEPEKLKSNAVYVPYRDDKRKYHTDIGEMITIPNLNISAARDMIERETKEFQEWFEGANKEKAKL
jgi:acetyl esterase/lipase